MFADLKMLKRDQGSSNETAGIEIFGFPAWLSTERRIGDFLHPERECGRNGNRKMKNDRTALLGSASVCNEREQIFDGTIILTSHQAGVSGCFAN